MRCEILSSDADRLFSINCIGYSDDTAITRFGPARRDQYIIHYVISGFGYFNGKRVSGGQGFLITPGMNEHYYPDETNPWTFLWVVFSGPDAERLFQKYNANSQTHIFEYTNIHAVEKIVDILSSETKKYHSSSELFELYLHIFNNHNQSGQTHPKNADIYCNYAKNYIKVNLFRTITVDELTDFLGITQPYLYKLFVSRYGISPKKYIIKSKLSKAKKLLLETDLPVCEVAASVGYPDPLCFSKQFKKLTGLSPKAFREL